MGNSKEFFPYYNADLQGDLIQKQSQKTYGATHFTRKIWISSMEADKIVKGCCPDCGK